MLLSNTSTSIYRGFGFDAWRVIPTIQFTCHRFIYDGLANLMCSNLILSVWVFHASIIRTNFMDNSLTLCIKARITFNSPSSYDMLTLINRFYMFLQKSYFCFWCFSCFCYFKRWSDGWFIKKEKKWRMKKRVILCCLTESAKQ